MRPHDSRVVRVLLVVVGSLALALGVLGIFLPVLPTTPFLLLAAACYARASERFYLWLLRSPAFGPTIREWRQHRSIPYRTKWVAIALMTVHLMFWATLVMIGSFFRGPGFNFTLPWRDGIFFDL